MTNGEGLNRRAFIRNAQLSALVGAVGTGAARAMANDDSVLRGNYDFDIPYKRFGTDSVKWDTAMKNNGLDHLVAGMGIADMDFQCAPAITKALMDRIKHENWGYLTIPDSFVKGIVAWNKRRYGIDVNPEMVGISTGVHPGLIAAMQAFCPPGSHVLLMTPTYDGFYGDLRYCSLKPAEYLMQYSNGRYSIDFDQLERTITRDTNVMILCNPQNPTGNVWTREELTRIGEICLRKRVIVLADEIHCDFQSKGQKYTPFSTLENRTIVDNSITFKAASKSFGLAAMKCAWFFTTNRDLYNAVSVTNHADLSTLGMIASQAAYAGGEDWLNQCVDYVDGNHDFVQSYFKSGKMPPLIKIGQKAQGTYLTWLDTSELAEKIGAREMADDVNKRAEAATGRRVQQATPDAMTVRWLARQSFVALNAGENYGLGGVNHMRMNIATSRKTLEAALDSIAGACRRA